MDMDLDLDHLNFCHQLVSRDPKELPKALEAGALIKPPLAARLKLWCAKCFRGLVIHCFPARVCKGDSSRCSFSGLTHTSFCGAPGHADLRHGKVESR